MIEKTARDVRPGDPLVDRVTEEEALDAGRVVEGLDDAAGCKDNCYHNLSIM